MTNSTDYVVSKNKVVKRDANLDLLRIISMMMVVCLHTVGWGGLVDGALIPGTANWYLGNAMQALSLQAVNCFVLISGYFFVYITIPVREIGIHMDSGCLLQYWCIYHACACPWGDSALSQRTDKVWPGCHNGQILVCD